MESRVLPSAASRLVHYNRATDSHSREFEVSSFARSDDLARRRLVETDVKTASRQEVEVIKSISMRICMLLTGRNPSHLTMLFRLRIRTGTLLSLLARGTNGKHANRQARTTILIAPDSIDLQRFIGDFLYILVPRCTFCDSLEHWSESAVRRFQVLQTEMLYISVNFN